jgi:hypothetical protein
MVAGNNRLNFIYHAIYKTTDRTLLSDLEAACRELPRRNGDASRTGTGGPIIYVANN